MIRFTSMLARALTLAAFVATAATTLSCNVNDYCLNCATGDGGTGGDASDANDGGDDASDGGPCVPTGAEQCDGEDNDCDLQIDEGTLPGVGDDCTNQTGACVGAKKVCTAGVLICDKPPMPELCDLIDNNCNGSVDEGDPEGGALCGTNVGECQAGVNRCVAGTVSCVGAVGTVGGAAETCNNRDDDCDGMFDEDVGALGPCTGGTDVGLCELGMLMCVGGAPTCVGRVNPTFELCNNLDEDCDGSNVNGYDLQTDPRNCGACGTACNLDRAIEGCASGLCTVAACDTGYHNNNGLPADGCEYGPCTKQNDTEICNGIDDDCSGPGAANIDNGITLPANFCINVGQCGAGTEQTVGTDIDADGSVVVCAGALGFQCEYADPDVSTDANGLIQPETLCDGKDNDCDGAVDEGQPNLGEACDNAAVGDCRSAGTYVCDPADLNGAAVCSFTTVAPGMSAEACDGRDNDCNGAIDDGFAAGNLPGQAWVTIPGVGSQIMKYEASRPDATGTAGGTQQTHVCSRTGALPWTNVTHPQAEAACAAIGARLCSENEWEAMCAQEPASVAGTTVAGPADATAYVLIEAEQMAATAGTATAPGAWTSAALQNFSGATAMQATPDNENLSATLANAAANAPRLRIPVSLAAGTYFVWVRMLAPNATGDTVFVGLNPAATPSTNGGTLTTSTLNTWRWVRSASVTVTASTQDINVWMGDDGVAVDAVVITRNASTDAPPFDDKIWAYGTSPKLPQPALCNGDEYDTNTALAGDQDDILATGSLASCFANGPTTVTSDGDAFDMSGNVKEWAAERGAGQNPLRGGSANNEVDGLACGLDFTLADDAFFFPNVGFRCCRN